MEEGFENSDHILEGDVRSGAQEHFYMETYTTLIIPGEDGEVEVISSTQSPTKTQVREMKPGCLNVETDIKNSLHGSEVRKEKSPRSTERK